MARAILDELKIHPAIQDRVANYHRDVVTAVQTAVAANKVVIVGMRQNPYPRKAKRLLDAKAVAYTYLEYGSYLGDWRRRSALKAWSGWPTLPMVFVNGTLIGGASDLKALIDSGEFDRL